MFNGLLVPVEVREFLCGSDDAASGGWSGRTEESMVLPSGTEPAGWWKLVVLMVWSVSWFSPCLRVRGVAMKGVSLNADRQGTVLVGHREDIHQFST